MTQRPLDDVYPVVFLDALVLKIRKGGHQSSGAGMASHQGSASIASSSSAGSC